MITRKTTIDQHQGTHPDGTPYTQLVEVVTEHDLDETDPEEQAWVDGVHAAHVALESLDAEMRSRAKRWLDEHGAHMDAVVGYRCAVAAAAREITAATPVAATPTEEQIAEMTAACPWSLHRQGDRWYAREVAGPGDEPGTPADEAADAEIAEIRAALPPGWIAGWTSDGGDVVIEWTPASKEEHHV